MPYAHPAHWRSELQHGPYNRTDLEQAKEVLARRFAAVAVLEQEELSQVVMRCRVPWLRGGAGEGAAGLPHLQQAPRESGPAAEFVEEDMRRATSLDQELYDFARELLRRDVAACRRQRAAAGALAAPPSTSR